MKIVLFSENQLYFHFSLCLFSTGDYRVMRIIWHTQYTLLLAAQDSVRFKDDIPSRSQVAILTAMEAGSLPATSLIVYSLWPGL
jgi:hypothetical protein